MQWSYDWRYLEMFDYRFSQFSVAFLLCEWYIPALLILTCSGIKQRTVTGSFSSSILSDQWFFRVTSNQTESTHQKWQAVQSSGMITFHSVENGVLKVNFISSWNCQWSDVYQFIEQLLILLFIGKVILIYRPKNTHANIYNDLLCDLWFWWFTQIE